jgi:hypothetical protein
VIHGFGVGVFVGVRVEVGVNVDVGVGLGVTIGVGVKVEVGRGVATTTNVWTACASDVGDNAGVVLGRAPARFCNGVNCVNMKTNRHTPTSKMTTRIKS